MLNAIQYAQKISEVLMQILGTANESEIQRLIDEIRKARRIFVFAKGRSGIVVRMFAMRLMHLGLTAYVVDETITPSIGENDLLLIASGSGKTGSCQLIARLAKDAGANVGLVTTTAASLIGQISDFSVVLPVRSVIAKPEAVKQFGGSYFEQALLICLDAVILSLQELFEVSYESMQSRHNNLE